jgi:tRNA threonylcarbamoyladenosine biosynthesis protein TsaB
MLTLALDTANRRGGFALARDGVIVASRTVEAPDGFAGVVYSEIESLLADHGSVIADVDVWAPASGPGSFTGVRVGLTAAKALAEITGKPTVPIGNLEAIAFAGTGDLRAAVMDARRGQVFTAVYDASLTLVLEPAVETWQSFLIRLDGRRPQLIATEDSVFSDEVPASLIEPGRAVVIDPLVDAIALLAEQRARRGEIVVPEQIEPVYVRRPDLGKPQ